MKLILMHKNRNLNDRNVRILVFLAKIYYQNLLTMKKYMILLCAIMMAFTSCKKDNTNNGDNLNDHPEGVLLDTTTYRIGDKYENQGVVFQTNSGGKHGLIVSFDEAHLDWCVENQLSTITNATNAADGWNNVNAIVTKPNWRENFPAVAWAVNKNSGYTNGQIQSKQWYLPAKNELRNLLLNQEKVNQTLSDMGHSTLEKKTYWSSTETNAGNAVSERWNGTEVMQADSLKTNQFYVRAIKSF